MRTKSMLCRILCFFIIFSILSFPIEIMAVASQNIPITFKYADFSDTTKLKLNGNAISEAESGTSSLRLTDAVKWQNSSFYYGNYVSLANEKSFSTMFSFKMKNPQSGTSGADGVQFIICTNPNNLGEYGGGIGYSGVGNSLGVEFDTFDNGSSYGDVALSQNHIAVNLNGDTTHPIAKIKETDIEVLYGAESGEFNFGNGTSNGNIAPVTGTEKTFYAWIDYDGKGKLLSIRVNSNSNARPQNPVLQQRIDLGTAMKLTGDKVFTGFTGATGGTYSKEYMKSWYFNNDYISTSIDTANNTYTDMPNILLSADKTTNIITATVKNSSGLAVQGVPVEFSVLSGPMATFKTPTTAITDANGIANATIDGSNVPNGTIVVNGAISASIGGKNATVSIDNFGNADISAVISDGTVSARKGATYHFTGKEFLNNYTSNINNIKIISLPSVDAGILNYNGTKVNVGDVISASNFSFLTFAVTSAFVGTSAFKWQASSNGSSYSNSANTTFNITANHAPVPSNLVITTKMNTPIVSKITATDEDKDTLFYFVGASPTKGTLDLNASTGEFTYSPNNNAIGYDSFCTTIYDLMGSVVTLNVVITIGEVTATSVNPNTGVFYESNFADKNGVVGLKGLWGIDGGLAPASGFENRAIFENTSSSDYEITLDAKAAAGSTGGYGIFYHITNVPVITGYDFQFDIGASKSFIVRKFVNDSEAYSSIKTATMQSVMGDSFDVNAVHRIVITVKGNQHIIKVDGVEVFNFTDSLYASGYVGLRSWSNTMAKFSYIRVANLLPTPTPTPSATPTPTPTPTPVPTPVPIPAKKFVRLTFDCAYLYGYEMGGVGAEDTIKREEASALLYRLLKQNDKLGSFAKPDRATFTDVATNRWSFSAVEYMASIDIFDKASVKVRPGAEITRGEASKIIAYSMGMQPDDSKTNSFTDLTTDNKYYSSVKALVDAGILNGYRDNTIRPNGLLTRAEYVTMINRLIGRDSSYVVDSEPNPYPDMSKSHWAYEEIMRASFGFSDDGTGKLKIDPAKKLKRSEIDYN